MDSDKYNRAEDSNCAEDSDGDDRVDSSDNGSMSDWHGDISLNKNSTNVIFYISAAWNMLCKCEKQHVVWFFCIFGTWRYLVKYEFQQIWFCALDASNIFPGVGVDTSENWEMEKCVLHCLKGMGWGMRGRFWLHEKQITICNKKYEH